MIVYIISGLIGITAATLFFLKPTSNKIILIDPEKDRHLEKIKLLRVKIAGWDVPKQKYIRKERWV